jgi:hypothetical protein
MRVLYNTTFLTESHTFLMSANSWCTVPFYSYISPVSDGWKQSDQHSIYYDEIHTDDRNNFFYVWA